ncbi:MAG: hypothetical protein AAF999_14365 [Pseudomonadota bacterium]
MQVKTRPAQQKPRRRSAGAGRAGVGPLRQLAARASRFAETSRLATLSAAAAAPVQRRVSIGGKPVEQRTPDLWRLQDAATDMPQADNAIYADDWKRSFRDMQQYQTYRDKSAPVSVGLIEPYAAWYSIPHIEAGTFFVLGENHGAYGYRDLVGESNIAGKVLGESGNHALLDTPEALAQNPKADALKTKGVTREYMMESIAPKTYYSMNVVVRSLEKEAGTATAAPSDGIKRENEDRDDWIANYKLALPERRGFDPLRLKPYYSTMIPTETRYFMKAETVAGPYSVYETASKKLQAFQDALKVFISANPRHDKIAAFRKLDGELDTLLTGLAKDKADRDAKALVKQAKWIRRALGQVSVMEDQQLMAMRGAVAPDAHAVAYAGIKDTATHEQTANYYRERAMFQAILKARDDGFAFAGIGDNHAVNLKASLEDEADVPVITLEDLIKDFSQPAL